MKIRIVMPALAILFFMTGWAHASSSDSRDVIIGRALNCAVQNFKHDQNFNWSDVCYTDANLSSESEIKDGTPEDIRNPNQFELGTEVYYYKYTERIGVKTSGIKGGIIGSYTYRIADDHQRRFLNDIDSAYVARLEGRVSYGTVDYEGSGTWDGIPDWNFEGRGLLGYDFLFFNDSRLMPFFGVGYRYLYNKFSVVPSRVIDGSQYYSGYDRESTYVYIPLGVESRSQFADDWSLLIRSELDFLVWGGQVSHFENMVDGSGASSGQDQLTNRQKNGWGWRVSTRLAHKLDNLDIFVEPFIRYWHIKDSEWESITAGGSETGYIGSEPDNKTWEWGLNIGAKF